ncbi:MAG: hypothetical protein Q9218_005733 [Villophora microphyllina]
MLLPCILSALLVCLSAAVDVEFGRTPAQDVTINNPLNNPRLPWGGGNPMNAFRINVQICRDLPPGACCLPHSNPAPQMAALMGGLSMTTYNRVTFSGLENGYVAAAFVPEGDKVACEGTAKGSGWGPGSWTYDLPPADVNNRLNGNDAVNKISGASYIVLPKELPPDDDTSAWLSAEGMVGLVWPKGNWFSTSMGGPARSNLLAAAAAQLRGSGLGMRKRNVNSHIRSVEKGAVFCRGPSRSVWVNAIFVNGTEFKAEGSGSAIYTSGDGQLLNFTGTPS